VASVVSFDATNLRATGVSDWKCMEVSTELTPSVTTQELQVVEVHPPAAAASALWLDRASN
jgi:hypothetical protein